MSSLDPAPISDPAPPNITTALSDPSGDGRPPRRPGAAWIWILTLAAGLAAGFGAWFLTEPMYGRFMPKAVASKGFPTAEESLANETRFRGGLTTETSLAVGILGAALGLTLGLVGGAARGSVPASVTAGISGLVLGAAGGYLASRLVLPIYFTFYKPDGNDLGVAILCQSVVAAVVGAAAGAAFGLGLGDGGRRVDFRFITGGLLGAVAGVLFYQMAGAIAFPLDGLTHPISATSITRLFSQASVAILVAVGVVLARTPDKRVG